MKKMKKIFVNVVKVLYLCHCSKWKFFTKRGRNATFSSMYVFNSG